MGAEARATSRSTTVAPVLRRSLVLILAVLALSTSSCGLVLKNRLDIDEAPKAARRHDIQVRTVAREEAAQARIRLSEAAQAERERQREKLRDALDATATYSPEEKETAATWCPDVRNFLFNGEKAFGATDVDEMRRWLPGMYPSMGRVAVFAASGVKEPAADLLPEVRDLINRASNASDMRSAQSMVATFLIEHGEEVDRLLANAAPVCAPTEGAIVVDSAAGFAELLQKTGA